MLCFKMCWNEITWLTCDNTPAPLPAWPAQAIIPSLPCSSSPMNTLIRKMECEERHLLMMMMCSTEHNNCFYRRAITPAHAGTLSTIIIISCSRYPGHLGQSNSESCDCLLDVTLLSWTNCLFQSHQLLTEPGKIFVLLMSSCPALIVHWMSPSDPGDRNKSCKLWSENFSIV